jgi:hypothetical protein
MATVYSYEERVIINLEIIRLRASEIDWKERRLG